MSVSQRLFSDSQTDPTRATFSRDLRSMYASHALALGESLTMIGRLLGHAKVGNTGRYARLARDTEKAAAAEVGEYRRSCRAAGGTSGRTWTE